MSDSILLLDPSARAGRTKHRLNVTDAKRLRMEARSWLGNSRADTPDVVALLAAAKRINALLFDATEGEARLVVELGGERYPAGAVLSTLLAPRHA